MQVLLCVLGLLALASPVHNNQSENKTSFLKFTLFGEGKEEIQLSAPQGNIYEYIPGPEPQLLPASISHLTSSSVPHPIYALVFMEPQPQQEESTAAEGDNAEKIRVDRPKVPSEGRVKAEVDDDAQEEFITHPHRRSPVCTGELYWHDGCNWCNCDEGGSAVCTRILCRERSPVSARACSGNGSVILEDFCNWCTCDHQKLKCTTNTCSPAEISDNREAYYSSDTVNTSHSVPRKTRSVTHEFTSETETETAALSLTRPAPVELRSCKFSGTFILEDNCSWCKCINGRQDCTSNACPSGIFQSATYPYSVARLGEAVTEVYDNESTNASGCDIRKCGNHREVAFLAARGCIPEYDDRSCCPVRFNCSQTPIYPDDACMHQGERHELDTDVPVRDPCTHCRCVNGTKGPGLSCNSVRCPPLSNSTDRNCRKLYKFGECCAYDQECKHSPSLERTAEIATTTNVTCEAETRIYKAGDKMDFHDAPCQRCVCGANYTGPYGEGCAPIDCGYDTRSLNRVREGSLPIFYKNMCCPVGYLSESDSRISANQSDANPTGPMENACKFAGITVMLSRRLVLNDIHLSCTCTTPPTLICIVDQERFFF
ncbi:Pacifastin domain [Trinorchestia longiramus]|nr:Pacifastin domain [Trinorchestia longiramus]